MDSMAEAAELYQQAIADPGLALARLRRTLASPNDLLRHIAAAQVAPGQALPSFEGDFFRINTILASLVAGVKDDLVAIWPLLRLLESAVGTTDDAVVNFSMGKARGAAWAFAQQLAALPVDRHAAAIAEKDTEVAAFGRFLRRPGWLVEAPLLLVRATERGGVTWKIDRLVN